MLSICMEKLKVENFESKIFSEFKLNDQTKIQRNGGQPKIIYNKKSLVTEWMEGWMDGWIKIKL